jgi:hypothetical protein
VQSIGAIALDPKNSKNVWVGTGESWTRNSVSIGDGIYKSTDGGETWSRAGLEKSERIARIAVDPRNSDTVFAAVPGALWSDSPDRGLYKTTDGGKTWQQVLKGANLSTGCTDVDIDPSNPDIMFAAMWDFRRKGWEYRSGGAIPTAPSASGLFRSTDGGNTWTEITEQANKGFPRNRMDVWRWRSRHRNRNAFTRLSNRRRARCSCQTTAARHGRNATKVSGWSGVLSTSRT